MVAFENTTGRNKRRRSVEPEGEFEQSDTQSQPGHWSDSNSKLEKQRKKLPPRRQHRQPCASPAAATHAHAPAAHAAKHAAVGPHPPSDAIKAPPGDPVSSFEYESQLHGLPALSPHAAWAPAAYPPYPAYYQAPPGPGQHPLALPQGLYPSHLFSPFPPGQLHWPNSFF